MNVSGEEVAIILAEKRAADDRARALQGNARATAPASTPATAADAKTMTRAEFDRIPLAKRGAFVKLFRIVD